MTRRDVLRSAGGSLALAGGRATPIERPNILWITCEDMSPVLGCYGDRYAATPNLDRFATQGVRYSRVYATAPVCSPARSCIITGVYANSLGSMHLRGVVQKPDSVRCFPELLRELGYYTTNNEKEDYNFDRPPGTWDESSGKAHWRNRPGGKPFFSVFNLMATHQGQIRYSREEFERINASMPKELRHNPAAAPLPPYYPDTPDIRLNVAILYTQVTRMDQQAGAILRQLEEDGLAEDTIVFFFSDHGTGLPRGKRFLHDSGLRVPFMVRMPKKYAHWLPGEPGSWSDRLVSFVDLAPTVLSLAGMEAPAYMQGCAFLGQQAQPARQRIFAARDRVDEEIEVSRTILDGRYHYIRNYHPHRPVLQHGSYSEVGYVWKELRRLDEEGKLSGPAQWLMRETKPIEELYDLQQDPHEMNNLVSSRAHAGILERLRKELVQTMIEVRDAGLLPESDMLSRSRTDPPYEMALDPKRFPVQRITAAAEQVGRARESEIMAGMGDEDSAVRYWSVIALMNIPARSTAQEAALRKCTSDPSPSVRIAAGEALCRSGEIEDGLRALEEALGSSDACVQLQAVSALWHLGDAAKPVVPALRKALETKTTPEYQRTYFEWAAEKTLARFENSRSQIK